MDHPFIGDLSSKTLDELSETINSLHRKLSFATRMGQYEMANQIQMALSSYRNELSKKQADLLGDGKTITGTIDIS